MYFRLLLSLHVLASYRGYPLNMAPGAMRPACDATDGLLLNLRHTCNGAILPRVRGHAPGVPLDLVPQVHPARPWRLRRLLLCPLRDRASIGSLADLIEQPAG